MDKNRGSLHPQSRRIENTSTSPRSDPTIPQGVRSPSSEPNPNCPPGDGVAPANLISPARQEPAEEQPAEEQPASHRAADKSADRPANQSTPLPTIAPQDRLAAAELAVALERPTGQKSADDVSSQSGAGPGVAGEGPVGSATLGEGFPLLSQADLDETVEHLRNIFQVLSDRTRLRILFYLFQNGELHVRALCDLCHQSQPAVSHHLKLLKGLQLVDSRREGKHNFYCIRPERHHELYNMLFAAPPKRPQPDDQFDPETLDQLEDEYL